MSGMMRIQFDPDMPVAAVEVLSPDFQTVTQIALRPGSEQQIPVPSEASFIRVHLPSGRSVTLRHPGDLNYFISRADLDVKLGCSRPLQGRPPQTIHEVSSYHQFRSSAKRLSLANGGPSLPPSVFAADRPRPVYLAPPQLPGGIVAEWQPRLDADLSLDGQELAFSPKVQDKPYTLRLSVGSNILIVLFPGNLEAAYVRLSQVGSAGRVISVRASTTLNAADTVGSYLARGDYYAAETMISWADQAEHMLMEKMADPFSATVGAYLLLRLERFDLMRTWAKNLADWGSTLADGCVIWAWQNIRQLQNYEEAKKYLLKAAERGLPLHTEGLRLLSDGLRRIGEPGKPALAALTQRAGRVVWNSPFTAWIEGPPDSKAEPTTFDIEYMPIS